MSAERAELIRLRARVGELEDAQRQLEIYAEDLRRTFAELRRQLTAMNELHRLSTVVGALLEPREVMARTLEGVGRLIANQVASIYLVDDDRCVRAAALGDEALLPPTTVPTSGPPFGAALAGGTPAAIPEDGRSLTVAMRASGGVVVGVLHVVRHSGSPLTDEDRKLADLVAAEAGAAIHTARLYEETQRLATTDPLTGLHNYRFFREALALEIARASRLNYAVGLLMLDLDKFKDVNDTFGHPVGDDVLRNIADVLRSNLRQTDVAARYGGEEFAVVLPGLGARGVRAVGEKLRRAVRALPPLTREGHPPVRVSVSVGGVSSLPPDANAVDLIRVADTALYEAKRRGRDRVCVGDDAASDDARRVRKGSHVEAHSPAR